jgi:vesicle-associated membrane protein 7
MKENLDKVLERGRKIEDIVNETETLVNEGNEFRKQSKVLRNNMIARAIFYVIILVFILMAVAAALIIILCGFPSFRNCITWDSGSTSANIFNKKN